MLNLTVGSTPIYFSKIWQHSLYVIDLGYYIDTIISHICKYYGANTTQP